MMPIDGAAGASAGPNANLDGDGYGDDVAARSRV